MDALVTSGSTITIRPDPEKASDFQVKARAWESTDLNASVVATSSALSSPLDYCVSGASASQHSIGLRNNGEVIAWGNQLDGKLANGVTTNSSIAPILMKRLVSGSPVTVSDAVAAATGNAHSLIADSAGYAWACGDNAHGQLGTNSTTDSSYLNRVIKSTTSTDYLTDVTHVAGGVDFSMALDTSGQVWAWGSQVGGRLGNGATMSDKLYAGRVEKAVGVFLTDIDKIVAGESHVLALDDGLSGGSVWVWGDNTDGKLGVGDTTLRSRAEKMKASGGADFTGVADIAAGVAHSVMLKSDGTVWNCGQQSNGRLGNGVSVASSITAPVQVLAVPSSGDPYRENPAAGLERIVMVAAGPRHSLALKAGGTVWAWGSNTQGQLGDGSTTDRDRATKVPGLTDIIWIGAGGRDGSSNTSFALKRDGTLYAWGSNGNRELADGTTTNRVSPVVSTANNFFKPVQEVSIAAIEPFVKESEDTNYGQFRISRSLKSSAANSLTVTYAVAGSAVPGGDYLALTGTATIPANQRSIDFLVFPGWNIGTYTGNKSVIASLKGSPNYTVTVGIAGVTIEDEDDSPAPVVYIADRSAEGVGSPMVIPAGTGTLLDPFDGSTADHFDAAMRKVMLDNDPSAPGFVGTIVKLGPGNFRTRGNLYNYFGLGWSMESGMQIVGEDTPGNPDQTVLTLEVSGIPIGLPEVSPPEDSIRVIGSYSIVFNCSVKNLTINCDSELITNYGTNVWLKSSFLGIALSGDDIAIDGVTVRGAHGHIPSKQEGWSISIGGNNVRDSFSNKIVNCVSEDFYGMYACGPTIWFGMDFSVTPFAYRRNFGLIENCVVNENPWLSYTLNTGTLRNNVSNSCGWGVRQDTGMYESLRIVGNVFNDCEKHAIEMNIDGWVPIDDVTNIPLFDIHTGNRAPNWNVLIENNYLEVSGSGSLGGTLLQASSSRPMLGLEIIGNTMNFLQPCFNGEYAVAMDNPNYRESRVFFNTSNRNGIRINGDPSFFFDTNFFPNIDYLP